MASSGTRISVKGPGVGNLRFGFATMARASAAAHTGTFDGYVTLTGAMCPVDMVAAHLGIYVYSGNAATEIYLGIFQLDDSNNATLVASTANLAPALNVAGYYASPLLAPFPLSAGRAYAWAILSVGDAVDVVCAMASLANNSSVVPIVNATGPTGGGQTVLPATLPAASQTGYYYPVYFDVLQ